MSDWSYTRCAGCPNDHRQVFPSGPLDARVMVIGEGPGKHEDTVGVPFVGQSGQELNYTYLRLAGLERDHTFVTNCVQCRQERNGTDVPPGDKLLKTCAENHLRDEIGRVRPSIIVLCGSTACSLLNIDLELEHGIPRKDVLYGHDCWIWPMYHPAAGMRDGKWMIWMIDDWERFGLWRRDRWTPPKPLTTLTQYSLYHEERPLDPSDLVAIDTESDEGNPFSVQISLSEGRACMFLVSDNNDLCDLQRIIKGTPVVVFHNALYDLEVLNKLGIEVPSYRDTMQELYHLGHLPQGLKAAVYRVFGHKMRSYDDVVIPHSRRMLEEWLAVSLAHASENMYTTKREQLKTKVRETRKAHSCEAVLRRIMGKLSDGSDYDPWQEPKVQGGEVKARLIGRDWLDEIEQSVGRLPRPSIVHVPLNEAVRYGCSDADWTRRLAMWLTKERERIVQDEWKVA